MTPGASFHDTTVLVTGAQGFIGSWVAERLLDRGARVVAPIRDLHPDTRFRADGLAGRCIVEPADVRDYAALRRILSEHRIETVFHLAAQPIVGIANRSPHSTWESNVAGTYALLEACRTSVELGAPIRRIVVASSDHAYGPHAESPFREDSPLEPRYPYDVSKGCVDILARSYASTYDMPVAVTRLANVFGGGDRNWSRLVPDTARSLARGRPPLIRSDGSPERDYLYVGDAADAYLAVAESLDRPELRGRAWNAGLGQPVTVLELVRRLIAVSGKDVDPEIRGKGTPEAEADRLLIDSSAIREELGWSPRLSLDEALAETYAWYERDVTRRDAVLSRERVA
jgi:CDP-glucose 4,6-dehydratase